MLRHFKVSLFLGISVLVVSLISLKKIPDMNVRASDKVGHFAAYFVLCFSVLFENSRRIRWSNQYFRWSILITLLCALYGVLLEFLQKLLNTGRHFEYYDMIANLSGACAALIIFLLFRNSLKKRFS